MSETNLQRFFRIEHNKEYRLMKMQNIDITDDLIKSRLGTNYTSDNKCLGLIQYIYTYFYAFIGSLEKVNDINK